MGDNDSKLDLSTRNDATDALALPLPLRTPIPQVETRVSCHLVGCMLQMQREPHAVAPCDDERHRSMLYRITSNHMKTDREAHRGNDLHVSTAASSTHMPNSNVRGLITSSTRQFTRARANERNGTVPFISSEVSETNCPLLCCTTARSIDHLTWLRTRRSSD